MYESFQRLIVILERYSDEDRFSCPSAVLRMIELITESSKPCSIQSTYHTAHIEKRHLRTQQATQRRFLIMSLKRYFQASLNWHVCHELRPSRTGIFKFLTLFWKLLLIYFPTKFRFIFSLLYQERSQMRTVLKSADHNSILLIFFVDMRKPSL